MPLPLSRRVGRIGALVLLMVGLSVTRVPTAQAEVAPVAGYGFSVGAPMTWMSRIDADRELDAVADTGATWLRVLIDWSRVEPMPGAFDWGYVDYWIDGARQRDLQVLVGDHQHAVRQFEQFAGA